MEIGNQKLHIVMNMMDDSSPIMRQKAIIKYTEIEQQNAEVYLLQKLVSSTSESDITCIIKSLTSISSYALSSVIFNYTTHESEKVRFEVLRYISTIFMPSHEKFILDSLNDTSLKVRLEALDTIDKLNLYSTLPYVLAATIISVSTEFIKHAKKVLINFLVKYPNDHILTSIRDYKPNSKKTSVRYLTLNNDEASSEFAQIIRSSITETLTNTPDLKTIEILRNTFENSTDSKRTINALYALNQFNIVIPTRQLVNKIFTDEENIIKIEIIKSLKNSRDESWIPSILDNFDSLDQEIKLQTIVSTKEIQNDKILETLISELLKADIKDKQYIDAILSSMSKYNTRKMLKPILTKMKEIGYFSSVFSNNLKFFVCDETRKIIYPFLSSTEERNVINAVKGLSKKGNIEAIPHLMESFFGKSQEVKQEMIKALGVIESDLALEHLLHISIIEDEKELLDNIEKSIKIISYSNPDSYPVKLYLSTKTPKMFLKDAAMSVLGNLGINKMFNSLVGIINSDTHYQAKKNAINLLSKSKDEKHTKFILDIIENKNYPNDVREFAFDKVMQ